MKSLLLLFCTALLYVNIQAQGIDFYHGSFEEAKAEARKQNKLIFMDAYASWCGPCKLMARNVFPDERVGAFYNKNFINLKIDMEKGEGKELRKTYSVSAYPTLLFLDYEGNVVHSTRGARDVAGFISLGKKVLLPDENAVEEVTSKWKSGNRDPEFLFQYIKIMSSLNEDCDEALQMYIETIPDEELLRDDNTRLIFDATSHIESPGLVFLKKFSSYYKDFFGEDAYQTKILQIAHLSFDKAVEEKNESLKDQAIDMLKSYKTENYKEEAAWMNVAFYGQLKDWETYHDEVSRYLKKYKSKDDKAYKEVAWNYYIYITDSKLLESAEKWAEKAVDLNPSFDNHITHAYILYKEKKYEKALLAAEQALAAENGKKENATILKNRIEEILSAVHE